MNSKEFDDITIVIPTFNRCRYFLRVLDYYNTYTPGVRIIVADSSRDEEAESNRAIASSFGGLNILYLGYHPDINGVHKMLEMSSHVETPYVVFCADDDFVIPNGIIESKRFLEKNPDYTTAHGHYIQFKTEQHGTKFWWNAIYPYDSNTSSDAVRRFMKHFSNYSIPTFYAVHRAEFLQMIFSEDLKYATDVRFGELLPTMLTSIYGKMKHLDVFYSARDGLSGSISRMAKRISTYVEEGTYAQHYVPFRECLALHLSRQARLSINEAQRIVDEAMSIYYHVSFVMGRRRRKELSIYEKLFAPGEMIREKFSQLVEDPSSKYYKDFNDIRNHVLRHAGESRQLPDLATKV